METFFICYALLTGSLCISEVCSNPPDETAGEFVEFHNYGIDSVDVSGFTITDGDALDDLLPWSGYFPQSGVVLETPLVPPGGYAVLLEEGYLNDPWLTFLPGTIILTTGDNAICNGLAASSDPLTLFDNTGTGKESVISTFGTPFDADFWEDRDDDSLDSIPFDPGEGNCLFRYPLNAPDCESAWFAGEPTPGGPPDAPPDTFVITVDTLFLSSADPIPGTGVYLTSIVSCWGTTSPGTGEIILFIDVNGDSTAQPAEVLLTFPAEDLQPGTSDTLQVFFTAPEQGWYPAVCSTPHGEGRIHFATGGGVNPVITEFMANPQNEDTEEFIEIHYPGPGVFPLEGCTFTDGDAVDEVVHFQNGRYIPQMGVALILDPEYGGTLNIPADTPLFTPLNTTLGNGLTTDDPVLLYRPGGNSLDYLIATAGTPLLNDDPLLCDDDGLDSIPFDPGDGCSMERIIPGGPDAQFNWQSSSPGGTPGEISEHPGWIDLAADTLLINGSLIGFFSNYGVFEAQGEVTFFSDTNGDLSPDAWEVLHQQYLFLVPGQTDSVVAACTLPDSGLFTIAATITHPQDTITFNNTQHLQFIPESPVWPVITEVLCNPQNEDCDEFIEVFFPGPGQADLTAFTITDNDSEDQLVPVTTQFVTAGKHALIMDPEYENGSQPYDIPPETPVFNPGNTTIGDGLSGTDPVLLLCDSSAVSQYGTPENPSDGIPFDPGTDLSVERLTPFLPDLEANWFSSITGPTPGEPPLITQGVDYAVHSLYLSPPMGSPGTISEITAHIVSLGTDSVSQGELLLTFCADGEVVLTCTPQTPGFQDTTLVNAQWNSQGSNTVISADVYCPQDQNQENNVRTAVWNPPPTVCINELFSHEPEWIELFNGSEFPVNLCSLTFSDPSTTTCLDDLVLQPGEFVVLAADLGDFTSMWGTPPSQISEPENWPSLNNSGDSLYLYSNGNALDLVPYVSSWGGSASASLERRSPDAMGFPRENWGTCIEGGTPGRPNSIGETQGKEFLVLSPTVFSPPGTPLQIQVNLPMQACNVTVKIYDVRGMMLEKLYNHIVPGNTLVLQWLGNDYPVGRYIVFAEAVCSGEVLTDASVVVLARPLH